MITTPLLGAHVSTAGGVHTAFRRALALGCTTMQVFTRNNNRWKSRPLADDDIRNYKTESAKARIAPVVAHAGYLINLCAPRKTVLLKSRRAFLEELTRCERFGIKALIVHPGAHMGEGEREGVRRIAESLDEVFEQTAAYTVLAALEGTAGQGTALGYRFEQLRAIIDRVTAPQRVAVCLDTCHLFAAGWDIRTVSGWERLMEEFCQIIGVERLVAIHLNDSRKPLGARVDRHEHIGKGMIGLEGFRAIMNDPRLSRVPKIIETPKGITTRHDRRNLRLLRSLIEVRPNREAVRR